MGEILFRISITPFLGTIGIVTRILEVENKILFLPLDKFELARRGTGTDFQGNERKGIGIIGRYTE